VGNGAHRRALAAFAAGGKARIRSLAVYELRSAWTRQLPFVFTGSNL